jgi:hypothetical protein
MPAYRGGNGSDVDRIVLFTYPFSYFKTNTDANMDIVEYEYGGDVIQIQI